MGTDTTVVAWLVVIGICSLMQLVATVVLAGIVWRRWHQVEDVLRELRAEVSPRAARFDRVISDVEEIIGRLRRVDDQVRHSLDGAASALTEVGRHVRARFWPLVGALSAVRAIVSTVTHRKAASYPRLQDRDDQARFVYEGGTGHVR